MRKRVLLTGALLGVLGFLFVAQSLVIGDPDPKVTICHASGLAGTTKFETLTIGHSAVYGPAGHFFENGTPRAGHEDDYLGECEEEESTTTSSTTTTLTTTTDASTTTTEDKSTTTTTSALLTTTTTLSPSTTTTEAVSTTTSTGPVTTTPSELPFTGLDGRYLVLALGAIVLIVGGLIIANMWDKHE